jgi:hypothetical protein
VGLFAVVFVYKYVCVIAERAIVSHHGYVSHGQPWQGVDLIRGVDLPKRTIFERNDFTVRVLRYPVSSAGRYMAQLLGELLLQGLRQMRYISKLLG